MAFDLILTEATKMAVKEVDKETAKELGTSKLLEQKSKLQTSSIPIGRESLATKEINGVYYPKIENLHQKQSDISSNYNQQLLENRQRAMTPSDQYPSLEQLNCANESKLTLNAEQSTSVLEKNLYHTMDRQVEARCQAFGGCTAHHIVQGDNIYAAKSKEVLQKHGYNINHPGNGLFLPTTQNSLFRGSIPENSHSKNFDREVYNRLKGAKSPEDISAALQSVKKDIIINKLDLNGTKNIGDKVDNWELCLRPDAADMSMPERSKWMQSHISEGLSGTSKQAKKILINLDIKPDQALSILDRVPRYKLASLVNKMDGCPPSSMKTLIEDFSRYQPGKTQEFYDALSKNPKLLDAYGRICHSFGPKFRMNVDCLEQIADGKQTIYLKTTNHELLGKNEFYVSKNVRVGVYTVKGVFADFQPVSYFETDLHKNMHNANDNAQMKSATKQLRSKIQNDSQLASKFTPDQIKEINDGKRTIFGFTWHHCAEEGKMQLVPVDIHNSNRHDGGSTVWGGGKE